jgi:hypothetical protein
MRATCERGHALVFKILWQAAIDSVTMLWLKGEIMANDPTLRATYAAHLCPSCRLGSPMLIEWPFWRCPQCGARLIPTDNNQPDADASDTLAVEINEHAA